MRTLILYTAFLSAVSGLQDANGTTSINEIQTLTSMTAPIMTMAFTPQTTLASTLQSIGAQPDNAPILLATQQPEVMSMTTISTSMINVDKDTGNYSSNLVGGYDNIFANSAISVSNSVPSNGGSAITTSLASSENLFTTPLIASDSNQMSSGSGSSGLSITEKPNRRMVTYDQRQDGQYNIRADLENFMIVLTPPNSNDGLSLLELLTKASYKHDINNLKNSKKFGVLSALSSNQYSRHSPHYLQSGHGKLRHSNFLSKEGIHHISHHQVPQYGDNVVVGLEVSSNNEPIIEFIEGRTPYHVDISSNTDDGPQARMQSERQVVDVLPPPYPLAYQQLMKPYHLEAQSTVIQTLPPQELDVKRASGNYLEAYEQVVPPKPVENTADTAQSNFLIPPSSTLNDNNGSKAGSDVSYVRVTSAPNSDHSASTIVTDKIGHNRYPRAISGHNIWDGNRVTNSIGFINDIMIPHRMSTALLPLYRSDMSMGAAQLYPPIDVPRPTGTGTYLTLKVSSPSNRIQHGLEDVVDVGDPQSLEAASSGATAEIIVPPVQFGDEFAFELHSNNFNDADTKSLLSDGIERCAPGKRRNSYGVCREIEGY